jgi:DNA-binding FadR family transcriptional regulator
MANLLEARESLEVPAAGLAALRHHEEHIERLHEAVEREQLTRARGTKFKEHRTFHGIVLDATGNPLIGVMTEPLFNVLQARASGEMSADYWRTIDGEHLAIVDRIAASDHDGAVEAMRSHLATVRQAYEAREAR